MIASSAVLTADGNAFVLTDSGTPFTNSGTFNSDTSTFSYTAEDNTTVTAADYYHLETTPGGEAEPTVGKGLDLGGGTSKISASTNPALNISNNLTLEFWVKLDADNQHAGLLYKGPGGGSQGDYSLTLYQNSIYFRLNGSVTTGNGQVVSSSTLAGTDLHHVAATYDGSTQKIWIDGVQAGQQSYSTAINTNNYGLWMGNYYDGNYGLNGKYYATRISNTVRYTSAFTPAVSWNNDGNTAMLWNYEEGTGSAVNDDSSSNVDGTASGTYSWVDAPTEGGGGGWVVSGANDATYNGTYTESGTMNGQLKYTNGSRWLYYNQHSIPAPGNEWALYSSASDCMDVYMCTAYYQYPGNENLASGSWYAGEGYSGTPAFEEAAAAPDFSYTFAAGNLNVEGDYTNSTEIDAVTNDPVINIDGDFINEAAGIFIASNSAALGVGSDFTNRGTFTDSGGTLTLDGQGPQTITAGGTTANYDFYNLIITNASASGVTFVDSVTVTGTFTDITPSSKITFHSGSTYAFGAIDINGQSTSSRITLTSSSVGSPWNLNVTAANPVASNVSVRDSNANKDIDATTGGFDATGNTHWLFPVSVNISGTVYTAENKSTNIGAGKTIALSIQGGEAVTVDTTSGGVFAFEELSFGTNDTIAVYISGETEKGSLLTQAANGTSSITGLELFTNHIVLTHNTAGPMSNSLLAIADNVANPDLLVSVDGSSAAAFADTNQVWILDNKTYTPGGAVSLHDVNIDGTLTLASNAATVSGSWDSTGGNFTTSGTVTFNNSNGTETLTTGGLGGSGGYTVSGLLGDNAFTGSYTESGTMNGQSKYTNGSKWLYYNLHDMPGPGYEWALADSASNCSDTYFCTAYYQYPGSTDPTSGTWYASMGYTGTPTLSVAPSGGGTFTNLTKTGNGALQVSTDEVQVDGTLSIGNGATFDINGEDLTLATLSNDGTFKLQGGESAVAITTMDTNSGLVEYVGTGTYTALKLGNSYYDLKLNGSGGSYSPNGTVTVANDLDVSQGTLAGTQSININGGNVTGNGIINLTGGTFTLDETGNFGGNTNWTFYNLTFGNGSGATATTKTGSNQITVTAVMTIAASQELNAGDDTWVLSGTGTPLVKTGTLTPSASTIKYTGAGDATITAADYWNLETSPSGGSAGGGWSLSGAGDSSCNGDYSESGTYNSQPAYTNGTKWLFWAQYNMPEPGSTWAIYSSKTSFMDIGFDADYYQWPGGALPGSWYTNLLFGNGPAPSFSELSSEIIYTFSPGTFNINGNYTNGDGTNSVTTNLDTNDPTFSVDGNFSNSASATFTASASASFSVASNFVNNASANFTHSSGTITFDGQGIQNITSGGDPFGNAVVSNTFAEVAQTDASTIAGTLTTNVNTLYDINGQNITLATLSNNGTFRLQGGESTFSITNKDLDSGIIEYDGAGNYNSLKYGNTYFRLRVNGSGTFSLGAACVVKANLTLASGTLSTSATNHALTIGENTTTNGSFSQTGGVFQANNSTVTSYGNYSVTGGTYTAGGSTLVLNSTPQNILLTGNGYSFNNVTFLNASGASIRTITLGSGTITTAGNMLVRANGTRNLIVNASTNNPNVNILGNLSYTGTGSGTETINFGNGDWDINGNFDSSLGNANFDNSRVDIAGDFIYGTVVAGNSTILLSGVSKSIQFGVIAEFNNITVSGSYATNSGNMNIVGTLDVSGTLTWDLAALSVSGTGALNINGTINGAGELGLGGLVSVSTGGTININTIWWHEGGEVQTLQARNYQKNLTVQNPHASVYNYQVSAGELSVGGNFYVDAYSSGNIDVNFATNNPSVNIEGDVDFVGTGGGSESITAGSGTFNVGRNLNLTAGNFTAGNSNFILDGSDAQTITSAAESFNNLTITNASASGVTFADSATVTGTFTDITPSSKITFHSGSTYAFGAININGQAEGTRITLTSSSAGSPWNLNITANNPVASNVSVRDSNANKDIDATVGGQDLTGNTHWLFYSANSAPVNNSLTFTNPYSSNTAISDDITEWNFRAQVTDVNGPANLDYVDLRLANSSDFAQPYDSLKFRWSEATDSFSEQVDTQNAASITSTSTQSNSSGNQWTLDFKIKFNSNFANNDTNYDAELYSIDETGASDSDNYAAIYQSNSLFISASVDNASIAFGQLLPGSVLTGTTIVTVSTNYPNGYSISAADATIGTDSALLNSDSSTRIADYSGTIATPTAWAGGTGFGICVYSGTNKNLSLWGNGTGENDPLNKYAGVPQIANMIHQKTGTPTLNDQTRIGYKLVVPNTQKTGDYSGEITYTATGALN